MSRSLFFITLLLINCCVCSLQAQNTDRAEMAHQLLMNIATDGDFNQSFSLLEKDGLSEASWHQQLLDYCSAIYENDSIPDRELAFADRTLEQLASSEYSPKTVVANAAYILGNIAFNARDYHYLQLNLDRLRHAAESLPSSNQLHKAISTLEQRGEYIQSYAEDFVQRMTGTWMSAETNGHLIPVAIIDIMPDSIIRDANVDRYPERGTKEVVFSPETRQVAAFFGYNMEGKGNTALAVGIAKAGEHLSHSMTRSIAIRNRRRSTVGSQFAMFSSEMSGMLAQGMAKIFSGSENISDTYDYYVRELYPGIARLDIQHKVIYESSQKGVSKYDYTKSLYVYKINPEDSIAFAKYQDKKGIPCDKTHTRFPLGSSDPDRYLESINQFIFNCYGGQEAYKQAVKSKEYIARIPQHLQDYARSGQKWYNVITPFAANIIMNQRLSDKLSTKVNSIPKGMLEQSLLQDLETDISLRLNNKGFFPTNVTIYEYPNLGTIEFQGVYDIAPVFRGEAKPIGLNSIYYWDVSDFELPNELALMQAGEIPASMSMEKIYKKLRDTVLPVEGVMTGYDKKRKKNFRYEGEFKDRKFHGKGKLWLDEELIHDGMFENGKPVQ